MLDIACYTPRLALPPNLQIGDWSPTSNEAVACLVGGPRALKESLPPPLIRQTTETTGSKYQARVTNAVRFWGRYKQRWTKQKANFQPQLGL